MIDRRDKKPLRAYVLGLSDAQLAYVRDEVAREEKRRRLQVRERRAKKLSPFLALAADTEGDRC